MKREASRAGAPMVEPIDPFLPETGWPRQIDPAHWLEPAQAAHDRTIRGRAIEKERRTDSLAQLAIGDPAADRMVENVLDRFAGQGGPRFDRRAQTHAENFLEKQSANQRARAGRMD